MPSFRAVAATLLQPTWGASWAYTVFVEVQVASDRGTLPRMVPGSSLWIWQALAGWPAGTVPPGI